MTPITPNQAGIRAYQSRVHPLNASPAVGLVRVQSGEPMDYGSDKVIQELS